MPVRETLTFNEGTHGDPITLAAPIIEVSGATYTSQAIHGTHALSAATGSQFVRIANEGTITHSGSVYVRITNNPGAGSARLIACTSAANALLASVRAHNDGRIDVANIGNVRQDVTDAPYTVGQPLRLDWQWNQTTLTAPVLTVRVFLDPEGETPDDTIGFTASVDANAARWQLGAVSGATAWSAVLDTMRLADGLEWIGPFAAADPAEGDTTIGLGVALAAAGTRPATATTAISATVLLGASGARASTGHSLASVDVAAAAAGARTSAGATAADATILAAASATRPSDGSTTAGVEATVAASGARPSSGSSPPQLGVTATADGARAALAEAAPSLTVAFAASGRRSPTGAAASVAHLQLAAAGSRPSSGTATVTAGVSSAGVGGGPPSATAAATIVVLAAAAGRITTVGAAEPSTALQLAATGAHLAAASATLSHRLQMTAVGAHTPRGAAHLAVTLAPAATEGATTQPEPAPQRRTLRIGGEDRDRTVPRETRLLPVAAEHRTVEAP